jgi:hypothetical protein
MFLELSRPAGDVSRWEKILKRLNLLNEHYPFKSPIDCGSVNFQRNFENKKKDEQSIVEEERTVYNIVRDTFSDLGVIFFGGYGCSLYSIYLPKSQEKIIKKIPDFDVLSEDPDKTAVIVKEKLMESNIHNVKIVRHEEIGELIPYSVEIKINQETIAFIYKPIACHNYNTIHIDKKEINVATIDTILSFYLAFYYANKPYYYYYRDRFLCMAQFMFDVEEKNRLEQKGLLKRFSIMCYGKQKALEDIRAEKAVMFSKLQNKKNTVEYEMWFLKYNPAEHKRKNYTHLKKKPLKKFTQKNSKKRNEFLF